MNRRRVVITGLGCITALAESADGLFAALCEGKSGVSNVESFDCSTFPVRFGGEIKTFDATKYIDFRESKRMDRFSQFSVAAAVQAVNDSGLDFSKEDVTRIGVIVATGIGGIQEIEQQHIKLLNKGVRLVSPFTVPKLMANAGCGNIAIRYGLKGPNFCVVSACASSNHAIGEAFCNIVYGRSDIVITGGAEAALSPVGLASFCAARSLSTRNDDPAKASRPFDRDRDGFVIGEGAGIVILESLEHAKGRGARIYAEVAGYGMSSDAYHITAPSPDGRGAALCMAAALRDADISPECVDYISAHGTSTKHGDEIETAAIKKVFGEHAYRLCVSSTKSMTGHLLGAAGGVEAVFTVLSILHDIVPPTINLENPDDECDLDYIPNSSRSRKVECALSNSFGFGGTNACLLFKEYRES